MQKDPQKDLQEDLQNPVVASSRTVVAADSTSSVSLARPASGYSSPVLASSDRSSELVATTTRYLDYFQLVTQVAKTLTSNLKLDDVLEQLMRAVSIMLAPKDWSLLLLDDEKNELYFQIVVGEAADAIRNMRLKIGEGIAGWVAQHCQPVVVTSVNDDPRFCNRMDQQSSFQTSSVVAAPLMAHGKLLGVIELVRPQNSAEPFTVEHLRMVEPFADFVAIAIHNARAYRRIEELTIIDEWTNLYNARFLATYVRDEVARAKRYGRQLSLVFFDLDGFKKVNDTYGHSAGSQLLREVGRLTSDNVRETDRAVRYGGDEFVVVMPETDKAGGTDLAERLREQLASHCFLGYERDGLHLSASFGVATFPDDAVTPQELVDTADRAMYLGKARGRNTVVDAGELTSAPPTPVPPNGPAQTMLP